MIGEKRKLTLEVPNFCNKKRASNTTIERASTIATIFKNYIFRKEREEKFKRDNL